MSSSGCWRSPIKSSGRSNVRTHSKFASHDAQPDATASVQLVTVAKEESARRRMTTSTTDLYVQVATAVGSVKRLFTYEKRFYTLTRQQIDRGSMIESFRHKGLKRLFENDDPKGVNAEHVRKIKQILALLDAAEKVTDLAFTTFRLHPLKGDLKGFYSLTVRANWRIIFRFDNGKASDVDLVDYH